jgi:hypothetical protein
MDTSSLQEDPTSTTFTMLTLRYIGHNSCLADPRLFVRVFLSLLVSFCFCTCGDIQVNYGTPMVPLDKLFGTFEDGSRWKTD